MSGSIQKRGKDKYLLTVSSGTDVDGKRIRHTKTIKAKSDRELEKALALFVSDVERGVISNKNKITFGEFGEKWLTEYAEKRLAIKTVHEYKSLFKEIKESLGKLRVAELKPYHLTNFYNKLRTREIKSRSLKKENTEEKRYLSESSIAHYHRLIAAILETARKEYEIITENPARKLQQPPRERNKPMPHYGNAEDSIAFLNALSSESLNYKLMFMLLMLAGLRIGEVLGLEWKDINWDKAELSVCRTSAYTPSKGVYTATPKTEKSNRKILIPKQIVDLLKEHKTVQDSDKAKLNDSWQDTDRLFTQWNGKPIHPTTPRHWLQKFIKKHKLPKIVPHGLRHTHASLLIANHVDWATVSERLGHANKSTTMNTYAHMIEGKEKAAVEKLEQIFFSETNSEKNT